MTHEEVVLAYVITRLQPLRGSFKQGELACPIATVLIARHGITKYNNIMKAVALTDSLQEMIATQLDGLDAKQFLRGWEGWKVESSHPDFILGAQLAKELL